MGESKCKEHKDKAESPVQHCFFVLDDCWSNEYFYLKGSTEVHPNTNICVAVFRPSLPKSVHVEVMQTSCHQRGGNYNVGNEENSIAFGKSTSQRSYSKQRTHEIGEK